MIKKSSICLKNMSGIDHLLYVNHQVVFEIYSKHARKEYHAVNTFASMLNVSNNNSTVDKLATIEYRLLR